MALITMVCYDTPQNGRSKYSVEAIPALAHTVDLQRHDVVIYLNGCTDKKTIECAKDFDTLFTIVESGKNLGTAGAINESWRLFRDGRHAIKIDNDVIVHQDGWADMLEDAVKSDPAIGIVGLKRNDLEQRPGHEASFFNSKLYFLPKTKSDKWIVFEETDDVMGTCVLHSSLMLDKCGYMQQFGVYGYDDTLFSIRSRASGFKNGFLPYIPISHIDEGDHPYILKKRQQAIEAGPLFDAHGKKVLSGEESFYYNPYNQ